MKSAVEPEYLETELKLQLPPDGAAALVRHPLLQRYASAQPYRIDVTSHYYDTPELDIKRHGASLRVREADQQFFQTLKGGDGGALGLGGHGEWEGPVAGPELDLRALRGMLGHKTRWNRLLRKRAVKRRLRPVFDTRISRTIWALRLPDGGEIELALDQGAIERDNMREPISEVELELKAGAPGKLYDFALELLDTVPMRLGESSKAERGYALCLPFPQRHPALKAARIELSDDMTVARGFRAIVGACLAHVQGNTAGVAEGGDVESVHQMRVGLRRLDSAFDLFKDRIAVPDTLKGELDWLGGQLGAARDWEVLAYSTLARIEEGDVASLRAAVADAAREKHARAAEAVTSARYAKAMLACAAWIEGATWWGGDRDGRRALEAPMTHCADRILARAQRRLLRRGRRLDGADPHLRHRVRIAAKKMRYATEFFASLYPRKRVDAYIAHLSALQDELGYLNDTAIGDGLLLELTRQRGDLTAEVGYARGYLASVCKNEDERLRQLWTEVEPLRPPRH